MFMERALRLPRDVKRSAEFTGKAVAQLGLGAEGRLCCGPRLSQSQLLAWQAGVLTAGLCLLHSAVIQIKTPARPLPSKTTDCFQP